MTIKKIQLTRVEGLPHLCGKPQIAFSFEQATATLRQMLLENTPKGADKVDFNVLWENGDQWNDTYLLRAYLDDPYGLCLKKHIISFITVVLSDSYKAYYTPDDIAYMHKIKTNLGETS